MNPQARVVSRDEWLQARIALLAAEKELTRQRDEVSRQRRTLPWVRIEQEYVFEGLQGPQSLADLFDGHSQLAVYHFMFGPTWEEGCKSCSFLADHFDSARIHLAHRDTSLAVVSRAPISRIAAFQKRMGWKFPWVSAAGNTFPHDFGVHFTKEELAAGDVTYNYTRGRVPLEDLPGLSVFYRNESGELFHTYSTYARGLDPLIGVYQFLDLVPKGRDEEGLAHSMAWLRHHDRYEDGYRLDPTTTYEPPREVSESSSCCSGH